MISVLAGCQSKDPNAVTLKEVRSLFEEQQLLLNEHNVSNSKIFGTKLYGVKPSSYSLDGKSLYIYIYDSTKGPEKGVGNFRNKTQTFNLVSYKVYKAKNALLFYAYEKDLSSEIDGKIQNIMSQLNGE